MLTKENNKTYDLNKWLTVKCDYNVLLWFYKQCNIKF